MKRILALPSVDAQSGKTGNAECAVTSFDFGTMSPYDLGEFAFSIKNTGEGPLALKAAAPSCGCLETDFSVSVLGPGESRNIKVNWQTKEAGPFAQYVKVVTNCPNNPEIQLWVNGHIATI